MKSFSERNSVAIGAIGIALSLGAVLLAVNYKSLPVINDGREYSAYFTEAGGLSSGAAVQVSGMRVGQVGDISLDGDKVLITFDVDKSVPIGDRTEAYIKTKSVLGAKVLDLSPRGDQPQRGPIPTERTTPPYQLPDALGDLTAVISGLNTDQLSTSLDVLANTFKETPPDVRAAVEGVARFSETLNKRDAELRKLLENARKSTGVLAERSDQIVSLVRNTNALLVALQEQSSALDQISNNIAAATTQISGFIDDNRTTLKPSLDKLNGVLTIVDNRKQKVQEAIKGLNAYALSLGESVSSGPFFKAYISNLIPGQFAQPFIDAAFSDLGLDPATLLPSERVDPPVGQPGTPALPVPFPRTGQGGEPRLTIPDAITGNPGDQQCGPPGVALPGPGCYPYREPIPAPPPGGPPPGPPAEAPPGLGSTPTPEPTVSGPTPPPAPPFPSGPLPGPAPAPEGGQ